MNLEKSVIIPVDNVEEVNYLASWAVRWEAFHHHTLASIGVEERFQKRLALWKRNFISKGSRLTFIRVHSPVF